MKRRHRIEGTKRARRVRGRFLGIYLREYGSWKVMRKGVYIRAYRCELAAANHYDQLVREGTPPGHQPRINFPYGIG